MNKYPSPIVIMVFGLLCVVAGVLLAYVCEKYDNRFSSSPSSATGMATVAVPVLFDDPNDIMYVSARETWPIEEPTP